MSDAQTHGVEFVWLPHGEAIFRNGSRVGTIWAGEGDGAHIVWANGASTPASAIGGPGATVQQARDFVVACCDISNLLVRGHVPVSELAHVVNNALAPTGHAGERLAALIAECGATEHEKAAMLERLHSVTRGIGKVDAFVREKTRQPAFVPPVKAPTGGAQ